MPKKYFPHLFTEGEIGNFKTRNRIVMLPMARQFQGVNGEVTPKTIDYFGERAKGGVGLIIIGTTRVFPPGHKFFTPASLNLSDNRYLQVSMIRKIVSLLPGKILSSHLHRLNVPL